MRVPKATSHDHYGYALIWVTGRGMVRRCRLVMEMLLGRRLKRNEHVHHVNRKKADDRPKNLLLTKPGDHNSMFHRKLRIPLKELVRRYESGESALALSRRYKTDHRTIQRWLRVYAGVPIRGTREANRISGGKRRTKFDVGIAQFLYSRGYGHGTIAKFFGIPENTMGHLMKLNGMKASPKERIKARRHFRIPMHSLLLQEVAEWNSLRGSTKV
jgi:hypothetical protein